MNRSETSDDAIREGEPPYSGNRDSGVGTRPIIATRSIAVTILLVGISQMLFLAWFGTLRFLVPGFERDFLDFKIKLPHVTELTIAGSRWTVKYWYVAVAGLLFPGPAMSGAISFLVRHRVGNGMWSVIWFGILIGFPLIGHLLVWVSLFLPQL
jgi:type II secretory pathway component PulF